MSDQLVFQEQAGRFATTVDDVDAIVDKALLYLDGDLAAAGDSTLGQRVALDVAAAAIEPYARATGRAGVRVFEFTRRSR